MKFICTGRWGDCWQVSIVYSSTTGQQDRREAIALLYVANMCLLWYLHEWLDQIALFFFETYELSVFICCLSFSISVFREVSLVYAQTAASLSDFAQKKKNSIFPKSRKKKRKVYIGSFYRYVKKEYFSLPLLFVEMWRYKRLKLLLFLRFYWMSLFTFQKQTSCGVIFMFIQPKALEKKN